MIHYRQILVGLRHWNIRFPCLRTQCSAVVIVCIAFAAESAQPPAPAAHELSSESPRSAKDKPNRVLFSAPPNLHGRSGNDCKQTPNFTIALRHPELSRTLADHLVVSDWRVETILRSTGEEVQQQVMPGVSWFWRAGKPPFAACIAQCVVLPEYARATRIMLTEADGHSVCVKLQAPTLELSSMRCADQTQWLEVIAENLNGRWVACGVVLSKSPKNTGHRMLVEHEYQAIQIGSVSH